MNTLNSQTQNSALVDKHAKRIAANWYGTINSTLATAAACAAAARELNADQKIQLLQRLPFKRSTFSKLVAIAKDDRIGDIIKRVPPNYSTLYEITLLSDEQKIINPQARRSDVEALRKSQEVIRSDSHDGPDSKHDQLPVSPNNAPRGAFLRVDPAHTRLQPSWWAGVMSLGVQRV